MTDPTMASSICRDDGFPITAAEPWFKFKVNIVQEYLTAFVGNLAGKVDEIIVVDLFAGNGLYSLGAKREIFVGNALMALSLDLPITKFVLCESDAEQARVLKIRVNRHFRNKNVVLLDGKPEELIDKLRMYVPQSKGDFKVAVICICDPFSLEPSFDAIDKLSAMGYSFLVPFVFALNDRINYKHYLKEGRDKVKKYLGGYRDIDRLEKDIESNTQFYKRMVRIYENNILALGLNAANSVHKLDSGLMEMPVYYFGFFSKQYSTKEIQKDVVAAGQVQYSLF